MNQNDVNKILATAFAPETRITDLLKALESIKTALAQKIASVRPLNKVVSDARKVLDAAIAERCAEEHAALERAKKAAKAAGPDGYHYLETARDAVRAALTAKGHK